MAGRASKQVSVVAGTLVEDGGNVVLRMDGGIRLTVSEASAARKVAVDAASPLRSRIGQEVLLRGTQVGDRLAEARLVRGPGDIDETRFARVRAALAAYEVELLGRPEVTAVRPGYRFIDGWTDGTPCIVAYVNAPSALLSQAGLPSEVDGVLVDVAPASPIQQWMLRQARSRGERIPNDELANPAGYALPAAAIQTSDVTLEPQVIRKSRYVKPSGLRLDPIRGPLEIICHASPDAGWPTLQAFLSKTRERLSVAMYDFTAPHILKQLTATLGRSGRLDMVLDPKLSLTAGGDGDNPKAGDFTESKVVDTLTRRLGDRFGFDWAAVKASGKTTGGLFPTAYHIKVAVRDGEAMWLSSGNWQSSNQSPLDPFAAGSEGAEVEGVYNREWHVIVNDTRLASTYEGYIRYDAGQAAEFQEQPRSMAMPDLHVADLFQPQSAQQPHFFRAKPIKLGPNESIQPLLTPDNYAQQVLPLLTEAKTSILFQNQYIHLSSKFDQNPPEFLALIGALKDKIDEGLDVRILLRDIGDARSMIEALVHFGIPQDKMKLQKSVHNKGIIIDDDILVLGSHNWSGDGTIYNRDASLVFFSKQVVDYFKPIFEYDWENPRTTRQRSSGEEFMPQLAAGGPSPDGMVLMPWDAYYGDDDRQWIDDILARYGAAPERIASQAARAMPIAAAASPSPLAGVADLIQARDELTRRFLTSARAEEIMSQARFASPVPEANVTAVGIGEKLTDGMHTGTLAVKLFVRVKYASTQFPSYLALPSQVAGLPVDVEEVGELRRLATLPDPRAQLTPARPGCSIGFDYPTGTPLMAGTFGALLEDEGTGQLFILSNSHVLSDEGRLPIGAAIFQTGLLDVSAGIPRRQIAALREIVPFNAPDLRVDAALAAVSSPDLVAPEVLQIGALAGTARAAQDMIVAKFGRTTGYTVGRITSGATNVQLRYQTGLYTFREQMLIEGLATPFSAEGDSGSLVVERSSGKAVGLLFAGSRTHSAANHIGDVLAAFPGKKLR